MNIPDPVIEAAADLVNTKRHVMTWSSTDIARAAIEAAMPAIREANSEQLLDLADQMDGNYTPAFLDGVRYAAAHLMSTACPPGSQQHDQPDA